MVNYDPDAQFLHEGNAIDYTPTSGDVAPGEVVVQGTLVGVSPVGIKQNVTGALQIEGVFRMKKDGSAYSAGDKVDWDGSTIIATAGAPIGKVVLAAAAGDAFAWVKLLPGVN